MNGVNKTLYIPLYGKSLISKQGIILKDPEAERIWEEEGFPIRGKSKSKWLAYNMAMRARVFDDWTDSMLHKAPDALVLHIGCGLDSRYLRIKNTYREWIDCDLEEVIAVRKKYFKQTDRYHMAALDASDSRQIRSLPDSNTVTVILEGISMYLTVGQLRRLFRALEKKYQTLHILLDAYTVFGARASKYRNPVNDVGVTMLHGINDINRVIDGLRIRFVREHTFTPPSLVNKMKPAERAIFKLLFTGRIYRKIYRLYELEA